ncbi:MAG TPA: hypothetical protein VEN47_06875 [Myxococcota bacterium]|nr:hypothetical protein [Myxococcota bacterium]
MSAIVRAEGAPVEQGRAQGAALAPAIRAALARQRVAWGWLARRAVERRVAATSGRALATHLPWQRERIEGLAQAARVAERALVVAEAETRVQAAAFRSDGRIQLALELDPALEPALALRQSAPDAGGFASAELTLAPLAGCLCGVNAEGLAAAVLRDLSRDELSLRFHAQELLFRARELGAGIDHLRRRAGYAGGSGTLLAAGVGGQLALLHFARGALEVEVPARLPPAAAAASVELDPAARALRWGEIRVEAGAR